MHYHHNDFDPSLNYLRNLTEQTIQSSWLQTFNPWVIVFIMTLHAIVLSPIINRLFAFGEEFGWRAYLLPKLLPLGRRRAILIIGIIWGIWHGPVIALGHNYGLNYPGAPWKGLIAMVWLCLMIGTFLAWITLRSESVWPTVFMRLSMGSLVCRYSLSNDRQTYYSVQFQQGFLLPWPELD